MFTNIIRLALFGFLLSASAVHAQTPDANFEFFEKKIRPVLVEHCYSCHSTAKKQKGGLALDSRTGVLKGGESGPAVVAGEPGESLLLKAMRYTDPELQMPPKGKLPAAVIADFEKWIARGAPDPRTAPAKSANNEWDLAKGRQNSGCFSRSATTLRRPSRPKAGPAVSSTASSSPAWRRRGSNPPATPIEPR